MSVRPVRRAFAGRLAGIFTDGDLRRALDRGIDVRTTAIATVMTRGGRTARAQMLAAEALQSVQTATTVRMRGGKLAITDGPFAETKEQLAGFYLIEAADQREAEAIAAKIPPASLGCVEVRPLRQLPQR